MAYTQTDFEADIKTWDGFKSYDALEAAGLNGEDVYRYVERARNQYAIRNRIAFEDMIKVALAIKNLGSSNMQAVAEAIQYGVDYTSDCCKSPLEGLREIVEEKTNNSPDVIRRACEVLAEIEKHEHWSQNYT